MLKKLKQYAVGATLLGAPIIASATDPDITSQLSTAATTAITAVVGVVGLIFVAAMALPVGKKTYRVVKSALGGA